MIEDTRKRIPEHDQIGELSFITNYFIQGCIPPFWGVVEFGKAPAKDLLFLLLGLDTFDIAQTIFGPKGKRNRRPGRHGRKTGRYVGLPDPNDIIGDKVRGVINPYDALDFGPIRKGFKILDKYEGWAFNVAAISGIEDLAFETLHGIMSFDPTHCPNMGFVSGDREDVATFGTAGSDVQAWLFPHNVTIQRILFGNRSTAQCKFSKMDVMATATVGGRHGDGAEQMQLMLWSSKHGIVDQTGPVDLPVGEYKTLAVHYVADVDEQVQVRHRVRSGFFISTYANLTAFTVKF